MYVRKTTRRYKDKTYTNYLLVESIHTPNGPRQKVVCSLGDLSPRPAEEWLRLARKVEEALVGQVNLFSGPDPEVDEIVRQVQEQRIAAPRKSGNASADPPQTTDLVTVHADRVTATQHRTAGPVHVGFQFWKRLEFDVILQRLGFSTKAIQLTCAMTLNRLIVEPGGAYLLVDHTKDPFNPSGCHDRLADRSRQGASHPQRNDPRAGALGTVPPA
jgi:hypothetical protein